MILNMPSEIILGVCHYLDFKEKLCLLTTCSKLNEIVSKGNLYEDLDLLGNQKNIKTIVTRFKSRPHHGSQVRTLRIDMDRLSDELYSQLSDIFPNVTMLKTPIEEDDKKQTTRPSHVISPILKWKNTLEVYHTLHDWKEIKHHLKTSAFPRLKDLEIFCYCDFEDKGNGFNPFYLVPYLKHAPLLTELKLEYADINLEFLEQVHDICPRLHFLSLSESTFIIDDTTLIKTIMPANSIIGLSLHSISSFDKNGLLLDYIVTKYPNLQKLYLFVQNEETFIKDGLRRYFPDYYESIDNVYAMNDPKYVSQQILFNRIAEIKPTLEVYHASGERFFTSLPKTLQTVCLGMSPFDNLVETLSKSDTRITKLSFNCWHWDIEAIFREPNHVRCLQKLTYLKELEIPIYPELQTYVAEIASFSVTKLEIELRMGPCSLVWLLTAFPSLEVLVVRCESNSLEGKEGNHNNPVKIHHHLKRLKISTRNVKLELLTYIKASLPNLEVFDFAYFFVVSPDVNMDLSNWNLKKCELLFCGDMYNGGYLYRCCVKGNKVTGKLTFTGIDGGFKVLSGDAKKNKTKYSMRINIKCDDIGCLKINHFPVPSDDESY
ncbi:hypothetical protein K501DRAFT_273762 [Backusella circina FSU 941]|nr:hypothetical protein K501DRAFT_273762 [Backusella circina FSU 941]